MPATASTRDWVRLEDGKGRAYYYNNRTSTSQWDAPADFREPTPRVVKAVQAKGVVAPSVVAAVSAVAPITTTTTASKPAAATGLIGKAQSLLHKAKLSTSKLGLPSSRTPSPSTSPAAASSSSRKQLDTQHEFAALDDPPGDYTTTTPPLEDRRWWGRPDRLRTESGEEAFFQDPNLRFRTSSSADLIQLMKLTRNGGGAAATSTVNKTLPRVDSAYSLKRPPSFMELDLKNGKISSSLVRPVKMNTRSRLGQSFTMIDESTSSTTTAATAGASAATVDDLAALARPSTKREMGPRRNTTNSLQIDTLMSKPDSAVLIRCVASLLHAQMVRFALAYSGGGAAGARPIPKRFHVFNEDYGKEPSPELQPPLKRVPSSASNTANPLERQLLTKKMSAHKMHVLGGGGVGGDGGVALLPDKDTIAGFIDTIYRKAQMESETIVMLLIYVERLVEATGGRLELQMRNWKPICMSCMILASKVWDDLSMWNGDFSLISGSAFSTKRINELEVALLEAMQYNVRVPASTYAKYYFQLRALRSTLGAAPSSSSLHPKQKQQRPVNEPLSLESAAKLEMLAERYQDEADSRQKQDKRKKKTTPTDDGGAGGCRVRSNTLHEGANRAVIEAMHSKGPRFMPDRAHLPLASLEQVVSLHHLGPQSDKF